MPPPLLLPPPPPQPRPHLLLKLFLKRRIQIAWEAVVAVDGRQSVVSAPERDLTTAQLHR